MSTRTAVYFAVCLLELLAAMPLILGRVKRNRWYGLRTCRTLASDEVWYLANRFYGWSLVAASLVSAISLTALMIHDLATEIPLLVALAVLLPLLLSAAISSLYAWKLTAES